MISKYKSEHLLWTRTAATRTAANASSGPEQLQMLQLQKQGALHHKEVILRTHKVNSCFGREQLQMLHVSKLCFFVEKKRTSCTVLYWHCTYCTEQQAGTRRIAREAALAFAAAVLFVGS